MAKLTDEQLVKVSGGSGEDYDIDNIGVINPQNDNNVKPEDESGKK